MALNARQQRFVAEYIRCGNATEAYRIAYDCDNDETANTNGPRLLVNAGVKTAVEEARRRALAEAGLTALEWAREVKLLSQSDLTHYQLDGRGNLTSTAGPDSLRAVASKKVKRTVTGRGESRRVVTETEIKLWNKPAVLRLAGESLGTLDGQQPQAPEVNVHVNLGTLTPGDLADAARLVDAAGRPVQEDGGRQPVDSPGGEAGPQRPAAPVPPAH